MKVSRERGQSLVEIVVGIAVGVLFIVAAVGIVTLSLKVDFSNTAEQTGIELANELINNVGVFADADWHNLDSLAPNTAFHLVPGAPFFASQAGNEIINQDGTTFSRNFSWAYVYRDLLTHQIVEVGDIDFSTVLVTATVSWPNAGDTDSVVFSKYLARNRNRVFNQFDWSGLSEQWNQPGWVEPNITVSNDFATSTNMDTGLSLTISGLTQTADPTKHTNIDQIDKWAWNDVIGWMDSNTTNNVMVSSSGITGYADSPNVGYIAFDCATSPIGDICGLSNFGVTNDGAGVLGGWAWNDVIGWISFSGSSPITYGVRIDNNGYFRGFAWNDVVGWISFNCEDIGWCPTSDYKTRTTWNSPPERAILTSSTFDTNRAQGAGFNTIMWLGEKPNGTGVKFQIATTDTPLAGPWNDADYVGEDGTSGSYYQPSTWGEQEWISLPIHNNKRYIRYRVILESDENHTVSPRVDNIIINWSY